MHPDTLASKVLLLLVYAALATQAGLLVAKGVKDLRLPGEIRAEKYPIDVPMDKWKMLSAGMGQIPTPATPATTARNQGVPSAAPSLTRPLTVPASGEAQNVEIDPTALLPLLIKHHNDWELNRQDRLNAALARRPVGFALVVAGAGLFALWTWMAVWLWRGAKPGKGPDGDEGKSSGEPPSE